MPSGGIDLPLLVRPRYPVPRFASDLDADRGQPRGTVRVHVLQHLVRHRLVIGLVRLAIGRDVLRLVLVPRVVRHHLEVIEHVLVRLRHEALQVAGRPGRVAVAAEARAACQRGPDRFGREQIGASPLRQTFQSPPIST